MVYYDEERAAERSIAGWIATSLLRSNMAQRELVAQQATSQRQLQAQQATRQRQLQAQQAQLQQQPLQSV